MSTQLLQKVGHLNFKGKVFVYYNINLSKKLKRPYYSIQDIKSRRVIGHDSDLSLKDVEFKVNKKGRQKVLTQKRKNVHAGALGYLTYNNILSNIEITYNPYLFDSFVLKETLAPINKSKHVFFRGKKVTVIL